MRIEEEEEEIDGGSVEEFGRGGGRMMEAKRAVVWAGARVLFYPTLVYNVIRNKIQAEFRWWDLVHEFLLLGAVPFPSDVPHLKQLGVHGVITLNEPYETLVPSSLYFAHGIEHLVIPTRDYLFAPSFGDICQAVDFIHKNASCGKTTYVHCKAGRGRSTTIVLCYLVQHKQMTPNVAYEYVRLSRPRVLLTSSQWQAVLEYYHLRVKKTGKSSCLDNPVVITPALVTARNLVAFDDSSFVLISKTDLDGYNGDGHATSYIGSRILEELRLVYKVQFAGQAALARLSCYWLSSCPAQQDVVLPMNKPGREGRCFEAAQLGKKHACFTRGVEVNL